MWFQQYNKIQTQERSERVYMEGKHIPTLPYFNLNEGSKANGL